MDFSLNEDQQSLKELAQQILADGSTDETLRSFADGEAPYDAALWRTIAQAGLLGLAIGEEHGGLGMGLLELGLLLEEQGRTLAPLPLHATLVLAALPIAAFGSEAQRAHWLPLVASGDAVLTAALEEIGNIDPAKPMLRAETHGNGWRLTGEKVATPYAGQAERVLVPAMTDAGVVVFLVDPKAQGVSLTALRSTSGEPQATIAFADVQMSGDDVLGSVEQGAEIARFIVDHGRVGLAALQIGVTSEALKRTAAYSSERIQFGRALGSMQAVQQRMADAFIDVEAMRSTYLRAAWGLSRGEADPAEIATAKYWAAIGGHRVTHAAQHLHGGIGADVSYPIHRYFLHAKQIETSLGGAAPMLATIGREIANGTTRPLA